MPDVLETIVDKFTFRVATDRLYAREGLWVSPIGPGRLRLGMTDYLQQHSGDAAFVRIRPVGTLVAVGDAFADLETIKVNQDLASPVSGRIVAVNPELELSPELVNHSPYDQGWLAELETTGWETERAALLDPQAYLAVVEAEARKELVEP